MPRDAKRESHSASFRMYRRTVETDVLGTPYTQRRIELSPDAEGEVVATLVSLRAPAPTRRAVLYVHGYVDYFFQTHLADFFTARGYDFYALDLRKYGRSLRSHQTPNFCRDVTEYFPELDEAIRIIRDEEGHDTVLVNGHSTGGLITTLWADHVRGQGVVQGLFLNSPFLEFNAPWLVKRGLAQVLKVLGRLAPKSGVGQELGTTYGMSIHSDHHGEWTYDLAWKPLNGYKIHAGWVRAMSLAQRQAQRGLAIDVPVLVASSNRSHVGKFTEAAHDADAVLNVKDIARYAPGLGRDVTYVQIEGGKHDLTLSRPEARAALFAELDRWLRSTPGLGVSEPATDQTAGQ
jgi:alpha-beta hydrolase superfamily lysophospholipase